MQKEFLITTLAVLVKSWFFSYEELMVLSPSVVLLKRLKRFRRF